MSGSFEKVQQFVSVSFDICTKSKWFYLLVAKASEVSYFEEQFLPCFFVIIAINNITIIIIMIVNKNILIIPASPPAVSLQVRWKLESAADCMLAEWCQSRMGVALWWWSSSWSSIRSSSFRLSSWSKPWRWWLWWWLQSLWFWWWCWPSDVPASWLIWWIWWWWCWMFLRS